MIIIKSEQYKKSYKKEIINKHLIKEKDTIEKIEALIINSINLNSLMNNVMKNVYHIEKKTGNLKEFVTARINKKMRLIMKPIGDYPYNLIEIEKIEFIEIDNSHYGEG